MFTVGEPEIAGPTAGCGFILGSHARLPEYWTYHQACPLPA